MRFFLHGVDQAGYSIEASSVAIAYRAVRLAYGPSCWLTDHEGARVEPVDPEPSRAIEVVRALRTVCRGGSEALAILWDAGDLATERFQQSLLERHHARHYQPGQTDLRERALSLAESLENNLEILK